ncbi:MAG: translation initiation factor Sui1 [Magnetococcales bacterium]|nr:translation initiation factor Sui1 [Magnetococcales bacterium]
MSRVVYSTEQGRLCPECQQAVAGCICRRNRPTARHDGIVRVSLETKGRQGKGVTLIKGLPLDTSALTQLCKHFKTACGSGGTVKDGVIEIQGDQVVLVMDHLKQQGLVVKRSGG